MLNYQDLQCRSAVNTYNILPKWKLSPPEAPISVELMLWEQILLKDIEKGAKIPMASGLEGT